MIIADEPYIEPTKLERLSLREPNRQQWVTDKVRFSIIQNDLNVFSVF
jgi:hypothetical protein